MRWIPVFARKIKAFIAKKTLTALKISFAFLMLFYPFVHTIVHTKFYSFIRWEKYSPVLSENAFRLSSSARL